MPNVFTPNGDGINDIFMAFADTNIVEIKNFRIIDVKGNLLFFNSSGQPNNPSSSAWSASDIFYIGRFKYKFTAVSKDGTSSDIAGTACCFPYESDPKDWDCDGCHFGTQHDGNGGFCEKCPGFEGLCY